MTFFGAFWEAVKPTLPRRVKRLSFYRAKPSGYIAQDPDTGKLYQSHNGYSWSVCETRAHVGIALEGDMGEAFHRVAGRVGWEGLPEWPEPLEWTLVRRGYRDWAWQRVVS